MIQRIQSVFLLLAGLAYGGVGALQGVLAQDIYTWMPPTILVISGLVALGALVTIFLYNDRKKQLQLASILQYLGLLALVAVFGGLYFAGAFDALGENIMAILAAVLPILGYIFVRLATARIKKDIELVRSMDRLR